MPAVAKNIAQIGPSEQESQPNPEKEPWLRQKNEPALWFMRFKRYLDMGPKRSLRAVVASEPQDNKAGKGNKVQTKNSEQKISDVSVPGAWSRSAKVWQWKARAEAYDLAQLEKQAAHLRQFVVELPFLSKMYRLLQLNQMATAFLGFAQEGMSLEECVTYIKTMQSLFKDIEYAMSNMDETTLMMADAAAHKHLAEEEKKHMQDKLQRNNKEADTLLAQIEKEMARRGIQPD